MNRNERFEFESVHEIRLGLTFASLEIMTSDTQEIQIMISGDDKDAEDVKVIKKEGVLSVDQPIYGRAVSRNLTGEKWMEIFVRLPRAWRGAISASTNGGALQCRGVSGTDIALDTVSGPIRAGNIGAINLNIRTVTGTVNVSDAVGDSLSLRCVSGNALADRVGFRSIRAAAVSADMDIALLAPFEKIEGNTVTGTLKLAVPVERVDAVLRSAAGRLLTDGVFITEGAPAVNVSTVSGSLELVKTVPADAPEA